MKLLDKFLFGLILSSAWVQLYATPQFLNTINQANQVFQAGNLNTATTLFIQGYWEFRNTLTQIWHDVDTKNRKPKWYFRDLGLNGDPVMLRIGNRFSNTRGYVPISNIFLGCWLNNSLLHQRVYWYLPGCSGFPGGSVFPDGVSKSKLIKKNCLKNLTINSVLNV